MYRVLYGKRFMISWGLWYHVTMEVEKCDDLLFAVWRSKRATGVLPVQTKGLRAHGAKGVTLSSGLKGQKWNTDVRGQETEDAPGRQRANGPSSQLLVLFMPSTNWTMPRALVRAFFTQPPDVNANPFWKHPSQIPEIMPYQLSGHPLAESSWQLKSTITGDNPGI